MEKTDLNSDLQETEPEGPEVLGTHVCDVCMHDNLLKITGIRKCVRCQNPFCIHFASNVDPLCYCVSCMSDLTHTEQIVTKTYESYNEQTDKVRTYSRRARQIVMGGLDWLFAQRKIKEMTDPELEMAIEYHRLLAQEMLSESERRRAEKAHRYAGVKVVLPSATTQTTTTVTASKKTTTTTSNKKLAQAQALISSLMAGGMSPDQIAAILGKKS